MAEQHSVKADTNYVVLKADTGSDASDAWIVVERVTARDAQTAVRETHGDSSDRAAYVAVPARSWTPIRVTPHVVTTLTLEQVKS